METEDAEITAAACRYLFAALLPRLERIQPGLIAGMRSGIAGDREAMVTSGVLSPESDATIAAVLRMLDVAGPA